MLETKRETIKDHLFRILSDGIPKINHEILNELNKNLIQAHKVVNIHELKNYLLLVGAKLKRYIRHGRVVWLWVLK